MAAYYNENDPKAAAWLRELIKAGLIAGGDVDDRSITEVQPNDLDGYTQCHFFAGIGGWSLALRLAGWADVTPVWTMSFPCQPFSSAGKQRGEADDRHLFPVGKELIEACNPATVFGEQVASPLGRRWLSGVRVEMETLGYGFGAADLCAASVGAPHIRQRLWWVADSNCQRFPGRTQQNVVETAGEQAPRRTDTCGRGTHGGLADAEYRRHGTGSYNTPRRRESFGGGGMGDATSIDERWLRRFESAGECENRGPSPWRDYGVIPCADGKARRIKPGLEPLVDGLPGRVGLLRGYGNAIVPQVAAVFIEAVMG